MMRFAHSRRLMCIALIVIFGSISAGLGVRSAAASPARAVGPTLAPSVNWIDKFAGSGNGGWTGDTRPARTADLNGAYSVAVGPPGVGHPGGVLYVGDWGRIARIDLVSGMIDGFAGDGYRGFAGDGKPANSAELSIASDIAVDRGGNVFFADQDNNRVRRIDIATGIITTVAGGGAGGDGGKAVNAFLSSPGGIAVDSAGALYISENYGGVRIVDPLSGLISTMPMTVPTPPAKTFFAEGMDVDEFDNVYIAEAGGSTVRKWDPVGRTLSTVAGDGTRGFSGDHGPATSAKLAGARDVTVDKFRHVLFINDVGNSRIREVNLITGRIRTVAGNGMSMYSGDPGPAISAGLVGVGLATAGGVAVDANGLLYIADTGADRIRGVGCVNPPPVAYPVADCAV